MTSQVFFRAYLVAWLFVWGMAQGGLALVMIHHLTGGAWGIAVRRIFEAQMRTLPLVALLFLPIGFGAQHLYPWAGVNTHADNRFFSGYFEPQFVWGRAVAYFVIWTAMARLLGRWSRQEDEQKSVAAAQKCHNLSGPGLVAYGITLHFAAIDWMMSIQSAFTSTIFGPIVAAGQLLSALALALVVLRFCANRPEFAGILSSQVLLDLGNLLLTLVIVWAYLVWCQFMLIWIGDLPRDNIWWLVRQRSGWTGAAVVMAALHFAVPFFLLLFRAIKQDVRALSCIAALLLVMQFVFVAFQVIPAFAQSIAGENWLIVLVAIVVAGIWVAVFLWLLSRRPILPRQDRNWPQVEHLSAFDRQEDAREEALAHG
jgi:hypothetical protein